MNKNVYSFTNFILFLGVIFLAGTAQAGTVPINIASDSMRYSPSGNEVVFEGNVHVKRPDFQIWAAKITIYLTQEKNKKGGKSVGDIPGVGDLDPGGIHKIIARGGVRISHKDKTGTCATATYNVLNGVLVMEGNPALGDGKNKITGHKIKFNLKTNRSEVVGGGNQRVNATFHAPEKMKK